MTADRAPAQGTGTPAGNQQRAAELALWALSGDDYVRHLVAALDAAEARGRAEVAAKIEALARASALGGVLTWADRLRALAAEVTGRPDDGGQQR